MPNTARVYSSSAPHVVGREALLEDAREDFIHETTRQKPWLRARYETLLKSFEVYLNDNGQGAQERPVPLTAFNYPDANAWLETLAADARPLAANALDDFADYLVKWGWLTAHPLRHPQVV